MASAAREQSIRRPCLPLNILFFELMFGFFLFIFGFFLRNPLVTFFLGHLGPWAFSPHPPCTMYLDFLPSRLCQTTYRFAHVLFWWSSQKVQHSCLLNKYILFSSASSGSHFPNILPAGVAPSRLSCASQKSMGTSRPYNST